MSTPTSADLLAQMMALHPTEVDLSLDRMHRLLADMGNPERRLPKVIHIAGTNGKGSTQAMLRAGLEAAGKRVQAYTSPHLVRFHERIRCSNGLIAENALVDALEFTLAANAGRNITFFEATTAAAFHAFAEDDADYLLLEVGLGGRFDTTNVVTDPALTIITPVSMDHEAFLGDTLAKIALEKAGILKQGVPCIVAAQEDDALEVIERQAARLHVALQRQKQEWHVLREHGRLVFQDETGLCDLPLPILRGAHQLQNAGTAISALRHLGFEERALRGAMTQASWPARMQRLQDHALNALAPNAEIWIDGGHNPAAGLALAKTLNDLPRRDTFVVCAMLADKDASGFLAPLATHTDTFIALTIPGEPKAAAPETILAAALDLGMTSQRGTDLQTTLEGIHAQSPAARVIICGSLYFAGYALGLTSNASGSAKSIT